MFTPKELIFVAPALLPNEIAQGRFAKGIWILAAAEPAQAENLDFLKKVLAAAQLDLERDTLFAEIPPGEPVDMAATLRIKPAEKVLVFGIPFYHIFKNGRMHNFIQLCQLLFIIKNNLRKQYSIY